MHRFSFDDKFVIVYVCLVCMALFMQCSMVVGIGRHDDKCGIFDGVGNKTLSM